MSGGCVIRELLLRPDRDKTDSRKGAVKGQGLLPVRHCLKLGFPITSYALSEATLPLTTQRDLVLKRPCCRCRYPVLALLLAGTEISKETSELRWTRCGERTGRIRNAEAG